MNRKLYFFSILRTFFGVARAPTHSEGVAPANLKIFALLRDILKNSDTNTQQLHFFKFSLTLTNNSLSATVRSKTEKVTTSF